MVAIALIVNLEHKTWYMSPQYAYPMPNQPMPPTCLLVNYMALNMALNIALNITFWLIFPVYANIRDNHSPDLSLDVFYQIIVLNGRVI